MAYSDITLLTDVELDAVENDVLNERERRQNLTQIPGQVSLLRDKFLAGGGTVAAWDQAVSG